MRGDRYFCEVHRKPSDAPIPIGQVFECVRVELAVEIAGVVMGSGIARTEAVARLSAALERLGAVVDVQQVTSRQVQNAAIPRLGGENPVSANPE
ncbi:MAG TPA: hypothetical protein VJN96_09205 [Vicinamibacterales bacterium]|nr:hypothetical protein [Vicinamibacterales bacterium]